MSSHSLDMALKAVPSGLFETIQFPFNFVTDEAAKEVFRWPGRTTSASSP